MDIPAAIFQAERDGIVRASNAEFLAGLFSGRELVTVPGAEHALPVEIPGLIDEAVAKIKAEISEFDIISAK